MTGYIPSSSKAAYSMCRKILIHPKLIGECKYLQTNGCRGGKKLQFIRRLVPVFSLYLCVSRFRYCETRSPTLAILPSYREDKWNPRRTECNVQQHESNYSPLREFYRTCIVLLVLPAFHFQLSYIRSWRLIRDLSLYMYILLWMKTFDLFSIPEKLENLDRKLREYSNLNKLNNNDNIFHKISFNFFTAESFLICRKYVFPAICTKNKLPSEMH